MAGQQESDATLNLNKLEAEELKEHMYAAGQKVAGGEHSRVGQGRGWAGAGRRGRHCNCQFDAVPTLPPPAATQPYTGEAMPGGAGSFAPAVPQGALAGEGAAGAGGRVAVHRVPAALLQAASTATLNSFMRFPRRCRRGAAAQRHGQSEGRDPGGPWHEQVKPSTGGCSWGGGGGTSGGTRLGLVLSAG